jgi:hypothetical protein
MSISKQYVRENIDRLFIAYSNVYIDDAVEALKQSPGAEAVVIQPHETKKSFTSTEEALQLYRHLKDGQGVPILFAPQGRMAEGGQFFEYGARLSDVLDVTAGRVQELVEQNRQTGKWVLQAGDVLYAEKNVLIVKSPIVPLSEISSVNCLPIGAAFNILRRNRGKPVKAVAIPAPKLIQAEHKEILQAL